MPTFYYKAKQKDAQTTYGQVNAQDKEEAVEKISQMDLLPVVIQAEPIRGATTAVVGVSSINARDRYSFSRQLASLLKAGVPLVKALTLIGQQISKGYFKQVIANLINGVRDGRPLASCLEEYPKVFSPLYVATIRAGEEGGNLREMLLNMAEYERNQAEIESRVRTALAYPAIMLVLGIGTVFFMLVFVMPQITKLFADVQQTLPLPTQILLAVSNFLQKGWIVLLIIILTAILFLRLWLNSKAGQLAVSRVSLTVPFLKDFLLKLEIGRFCRTLELLLKSGISILRAIELSIPAVHNELIKDHIKHCQAELTAGNSFGQSLKQSKLIPPLVGDLIAVGEESGGLSEALFDVAESYERETSEGIRFMTTLLEPLMIVLVGSVIGFIVFAILLPVFQMDLFRG